MQCYIGDLRPSLMRSTPMCHLISNISLTLSSIWRIVFLFLCVFIILFTIYNRISLKSPLLFLTFCQLFLPRLKAKYFKNIISRFLQVLSQFFALGSFMNLPSDALCLWTWPLESRNVFLLTSSTPLLPELWLCGGSKEMQAILNGTLTASLYSTFIMKCENYNIS